MLNLLESFFCNLLYCLQDAILRDFVWFEFVNLLCSLLNLTDHVLSLVELYFYVCNHVSVLIFKYCYFSGLQIWTLVDDIVCFKYIFVKILDMLHKCVYMKRINILYLENQLTYIGELYHIILKSQFLSFSVLMNSKILMLSRQQILTLYYTRHITQWKKECEFYK